jgi:ATP-dependent helicase HrpB
LGLAPADGSDAPVDAGVLLSFAYPDRIAQLRPGARGRFLLANGRGASLPFDQGLSASPFIVAAELDDQGRDSRVLRAAPLDEVDLLRHHAERVRAEDSVEWEEPAGVRPRRRERIGAIVLRESDAPDPPEGALAEALLHGVRRLGLGVLPWTEHAARVRERLTFLHLTLPDWPAVDDDALLGSLDAWLAPFLGGVRRLEELRGPGMEEILLCIVPWERRGSLNELAPTHLEVPSGSRIAIDYSQPAQPVLAARLQELFGMTETPRLAAGRVPVTIHLLSPARRPVQVTRDLASFWKSGYFEVRKELKGRYPKHYWPDDPLTATATSRVRPATG